MILLLILVGLGTEIMGQDTAGLIRIGVLAKRGAAQCYDQWSPTAAYLNAELPEYTFIIVPLNFEQVETSVKTGTIDFILTNPSDYVFLEHKFRVNRIATLKNRSAGKSLVDFGGVIFCRADRDDLNTLDDLKGHIFSAVDDTSFGGWLMTLREFKQQGIEPEEDFSRFIFAGTHDEVVEQVLAGKADAGTVRTDTIEQMVAEGKLRLEQLKLLNDMGSVYPEFPFLLSTRLYPEWPLANLMHTDLALAEKVVSALLAMDAAGPAAVAAHCAGWTIPSNYQSVDDALKELRVAPYDDYGVVTLPQILKQYWPLVLAAVLVILLAVIVSVYVTGLNHSLRYAITRTNDELSRRQVAENELLSIKSNLEKLVLERTAELVAKNRDLEKALATNNDLIREVHHRVKNNLQIIISLMNMQTNGEIQCSNDDFCLNMQRRIASISLVHELLFSSEFLESLGSRKLLALMADRVCELSAYGSSMVELAPDSLDVQLRLNLAIPIGLILSELLSNSLRHARHEGGPGRTILRMVKDGEWMVLTVADDGVGYPENFKPEDYDGLGLRLVTALTEQIHGHIKFFNRNGAIAELIFPTILA